MRKGRTRKFGPSCYAHERDAIGRVVYLAHPVRGDVEVNLAKAKAWLKYYSENNPEIAFVAQWIVECELWDDADPASREQGLKRCLALVERCDELWCIGESITSGMQRELEQACAFGITVLDLTGDELLRSCVRCKAPSGERELCIGCLKSRYGETAEFASKIERIPQELRDMSGVPSEVRRELHTPQADQSELEVQLKVMTEDRDELRQKLKQLEESRCEDCKVPIERGTSVLFVPKLGDQWRTICQGCAAEILRLPDNLSKIKGGAHR